MNEEDRPLLRGFGKPTSIAGRLLLPFTLVIGAIALIVFFFFPAAMERKETEALLEKGRSIVAMAAFNSEAAVQFGGPEDVAEAIELSLETKEVVTVEVRDPASRLLGSVTRPSMAGDRDLVGETPSEPDLLSVTQAVISDGDTVASVVAFLSQAELRKEVTRTRGMVGLFSCLIFLVGVAALSALSSLITRPLRAIVGVAEEISDGNLTRRAPVVAGDEIGTLAKAFNEMLARLESSQGELKKMNWDLEQRVADRTRDLMETEAKLQQIQKMEAVGRLAGGVAHDFNNLLTVITGHVDLLLLERTETDPDFSDLEDMKRAADRAADLTRQLLAFGRRQVLRPRQISPNQLVSDTVGMLSRVMGEHIRVETRCADEIGKIVADPGQLERAILNMAINARDAMPKGGILTLETESIDHIRARLAWAVALPPGRYGMLVVRDTGMGISRSDLPKVFEPFFSTKEFGEGSGLGLAMVDGIVNQSGGYVFVDSELGKGTEFRLFFPEEKADPESVQSSAGAQTESSLTLGNETILVVEDEDMVRKLTCSILERAGYSVLSVAGSLEAIGVIKNHQTPIDLVLTDVIMPGMTGDELAIRVRKLLPDTAVLFMSGHSGPALEGVSKMDVDLLEKPFTADEITRKVRNVLDRDRKGVVAA